MKKTIGLWLVIILSLMLATGCGKSEEDAMRESRENQGIEHLDSDDSLKLVKEAKMAHISIFNGSNDAEEYETEDGIIYNPFFEHYDSPEKIRAEIEKYYYGNYAKEVLATIPAKYIGNVYSLPIGDIGYIDDFQEARVIEKVDIDEENIDLTYSLNDYDDYSTKVRLRYDEGRWKLASEILIFDTRDDEE